MASVCRENTVRWRLFSALEPAQHPNPPVLRSLRSRMMSPNGRPRTSSCYLAAFGLLQVQDAAVLPAVAVCRIGRSHGRQPPESGRACLPFFKKPLAGERAPPTPAPVRSSTVNSLLERAHPVSPYCLRRPIWPRPASGLFEATATAPRRTPRRRSRPLQSRCVASADCRGAPHC